MRICRKPGTPELNGLDIIAPISKGGTGASDEFEAIENLGGITAFDLDQLLGPAVMDSRRKVSLSDLPSSVVVGPTLSGPLVLYPTQVATYTITNFDSLTSYDVSASAGIPVHNNDTVTYTAPDTASDVTLVVNGRTVKITVKEPWPVTPQLFARTLGSNDQANVVLSGSDFAMVTGESRQRGSDWEVALDHDFRNIVHTSISDAENLVSWISPDLSLNTTYFARVRYRATNGVMSSRSSIVSFTTKGRYSPTSEEAKLVADDRASNNYFGWSLDCDSDATRVVVGAHLSKQMSLLSNPGVVYVFRRNGSLWTQEAKIDVSGLLAPSMRFGYSVAIDDSGSRIAIGAPDASNGFRTNCGYCAIYTRNNTSWSQEDILYASDRASGDNFGTSVALSKDGLRIVVGSTNHSAGGTSKSGAAYVFTRSGSNWTQESKLVANDKAAGDSFGMSVAICNESLRVVVGSPYADVGGFTSAGAVYVYSRTGTTWTQEAKLTANDKTAGDNFGYSLDINFDCSRIVVGASSSNSTGVVSAGAAYVYNRQDQGWVFEYRLLAFDKVAGDKFGTCVSINEDGTKIVATAPFAGDGNLRASGKAYIFRRLGCSWQKDSVISASDKESNDNFGNCVVVTKDSSRVVVGSHLEDPSGTTNAGSVYIFS